MTGRRLANGIQEVGGSIPPGSATHSLARAVFSLLAEYVVIAELAAQLHGVGGL
jgi:hypothetical protein